MAVIEGQASGNLVEVGAAAASGQHVIIKPDAYGALGHHRLGMVSGTIAAALGANSEIFQFRWTDATRFGLVYAISVSAGANVAATAAGLVAFRAAIARAWSADGSGGTAATLTGNNQKLRTTMGTTLLGAARIATTAALGAGTKALDAQDVGVVATGIGTGALTVAVGLPIVPKTYLFNSLMEGVHPIVLAQNEGFVVRTGPAFPATMTWHAGVEVVWGEVTAY